MGDTQSFADFEQELSQFTERTGISLQGAAQNFKDFEAELARFAARIAQRAKDIAAGTAVIINNVTSFAQRLAGIARQGFAGTVEANRLSLAWQILARQLAAIAIPVVDALTNGMMRLTGYFRGLSGEGQNMALGFGAIALVFRPLQAMMPVIAVAFKGMWAALTPINAAITILVTALVDFLTNTEEGHSIFTALGAVLEGVVVPILKVVTEVFRVLADAVTVVFQGVTRAIEFVIIKIASVIEEIMSWIPGLGDATASVKAFKDNMQANLDKQMASGWGANKNDGKGTPRRDVTLASGRWEGVGNAFARVTETANKLAGSPEAKRHDDAMKKQDELIGAVKEVGKAVEKQNPAVGR
ncbi:MAG: hypothetical protein QM703_13655 [Gemmatales bacterium]